MEHGGWQKLADFGGGNEVWRSETGSFVRYDCGGISSKWRDDFISAGEAIDAAASEDGFLRVVYSIQSRLAVEGIDAYAGSPQPLQDPR